MYHCRSAGFQDDIVEQTAKTFHVLGPVQNHRKRFSLPWGHEIPVAADFKRKLINSSCDSRSHPAECKHLNRAEEKQNQICTAGEGETQNVGREAQNQRLHLEFHVEVPEWQVLDFTLPFEMIFASLDERF